METTLLKPVMSSEELAELNRLTAEHNARINSGRNSQQSLGKDDFLKLLLTQLANQDPTAPLEDKEFIAQMAQFSSLEQMNNMAADFAKMARMLQVTEASSALGKSVEILEGDNVIQGAVKAVSRDASPQVLVNGVNYNWDQVIRVYQGESGL
ncbi:MAG: flagellar hook assembly protein FlgD [Treponema sp.]|jgi:flagellar basal-body rod modification protein FlgD|nr:flagellar hook assembly protein FlgD [Treponema sp.]